ncbi:phospholipase D-like domain-containing protein [Companilactobacillus mishanensis]|uniref:restriction endonuclease PLD domain-containing protein n=1 Tax=Companilactobacillus mishanensis TaxID=2486008 RepID=UPI001CDC0EE1|nr:restriction endonuclease PLD domain-containing protein [Companilactobacillus mishanensis]
MFNQKSSITGAPYLDSKFQETVYAKSFKADAVDIGNTPHDMTSTFGSRKVGIGIKTWLNSSPSYQKVMQLKANKPEIEKLNNVNTQIELARKISSIKNKRLHADYIRLGLDEDENIYHYVTRDKGKLTIQETTYPLVNLNKLTPTNYSAKSFEFTDGIKQYKYTFGDSQIWMKFGENDDKSIIDEVSVDIMDDPFDFLKDSFQNIQNYKNYMTSTDAIYLPLYSFKYHRVELKSGLNAWNAKPKSKYSNTPRPEAEVYIPIPKIFAKKYPYWFNPQVDLRNHKEYKRISKTNNYEFNLHFPNGTIFPALVGQDGFKALQTNPQNALGKWLLYNILGLKKGELVTMDILNTIGFDSVKLWHKDKKNFKDLWIDFAPTGSFERFIRNQSQDSNTEYE